MLPGVTGNLAANSLNLDMDEAGMNPAVGLQAVTTFGNTTKFDVTLTGDPVGAPDGGAEVEFLFLILNPSMIPESQGPMGEAVSLTVNPDGSVTVHTYDAYQTPEIDPGSTASALALLGSGVLMLNERRRRRKARDLETRKKPRSP